MMRFLKNNWIWILTGVVGFIVYAIVQPILEIGQI
jgi:type II secretory pathway component PulF